MKTLALIVSLIGLLGGLTALPAAADPEQQIGQQVYNQLMQKGEIIPYSPLYAVLAPVASRISAVTNPQYQYPFHFILVHESSPNAFSVPGGNVYVTDSLLHFVDNTDELAGVLCHETSHTIHHDVVHLMNKDRNTELLGTLAEVFLSRGSYLGGSAIGLGAGLQEEHFSRAVETGADLKGSETCAQAGYNPYGMVWLFQKFAKSGKGGSMEMMSDHPRDDHRIADLLNHMKSDPAMFGKYSNDISKATPITLPSMPTAPPGSRPPYGPPQGAQQGPYGGPQRGGAPGPSGRPQPPSPAATASPPPNLPV